MDNLQYEVQPSQMGLLKHLIGEKIYRKRSCALILGDNIFYGNGLGPKLKSAIDTAKKGLQFWI